ncbi:MAG: twin-arginine translocase TatA/TatE family subunit [Bacillota bacterium]|nr:twin-arginine translocase TatA/TatE family subunit [Bacillota bacterium]MDP4160349.1 twin-arginine translocase TatA/TatE family subunit [Bacillota bacterium]
MGFSEILLIMVIALILFGPEDLPDIARTIGKVIYEIRKATQELTSEFQNSLIDNPVNSINKAFEQTIKTPAVEQGNSAASVSETQKDEIDEDLLTYDDEIPKDPLAELPADMVSYEEKGASR